MGPWIVARPKPSQQDLTFSGKRKAESQEQMTSSLRQQRPLTVLILAFRIPVGRELDDLAHLHPLNKRFSLVDSVGTKQQPARSRQVSGS